jgi:hypothetical protein
MNWHRCRKGVGGEYGGNTMYSCMQMEKWGLLKLFQEWGRGLKENDGEGEFCCNNLGKCHNVSPVQQ